MNFNHETNPIGIQPINWSNDDFHEFGGMTPLSTCLKEMNECGYDGTELGHKFPTEPNQCQKSLKPFGLRLVSGWHSTYFAKGDLNQEISNFKKHMNFLKSMGCDVVIIAECTHRTYDDPKFPIFTDDRRPQLKPIEWEKFVSGINLISKIASDDKMKLAYHHHMGTVVQNHDDVNRLMRDCPNLGLLLDTGHITYAGDNPLQMIQSFGSRITHVHLKNIRPEILNQARHEHLPFHQAVKLGVFTTPGDLLGAVNYPEIFKQLNEINYRGWFVVEAEQDPNLYHPKTYAKVAREYLRSQLGY